MTTRLLVLAVLVAASALLAVALRRRQGRARSVDGAADLPLPGVRLGTTATFVQFSSRTCAPCRAVRRTLAGLVADRPDVAHVELDVEEHLELVRRQHVLVTPTVLVLDRAGRVRHRLSGAVDRRLLAEVLHG